MTAVTILDEPELLTLGESVKDVLVSECDSLAVHAWLDRKNDLGPSVWRQACELGWLGLALPEADGGLGLGARGLALLSRELGASAAPGPFIATLCMAQWIARLGNAQLRADLLGPMLSGEASFAVPAALEAVAPLELAGGEGGSVSGTMDVLGSSDASFVAVPVAARGSAGASAFAVLRVDGDKAKLEPVEIWDLTRDICRLECRDAPVVALIDNADGSAGVLLGSLLAVAIAADSLGGASGITLRTVDYMKEREQFNRPIATFQALRHRIADQVERVATHESLLEQAVQCLDGGSPDAAMWARLAKAGASEVFAFVAADCIQLHGGVGHTWEFDPHIYAKRARLNEALLAPNTVLRDTAVELLDKALDEGRTTTELDA